MDYRNFVDKRAKKDHNGINTKMYFTKMKIESKRYNSCLARHNLNTIISNCDGIKLKRFEVLHFTALTFLENKSKHIKNIK